MSLHSQYGQGFSVPRPDITLIEVIRQYALHINLLQKTRGNTNLPIWLCLAPFCRPFHDGRDFTAPLTLGVTIVERIHPSTDIIHQGKTANSPYKIQAHV